MLQRRNQIFIQIAETQMHWNNIYFGAESTELSEQRASMWAMNTEMNARPIQIAEVVNSYKAMLNLILQ